MTKKILVLGVCLLLLFSLSACSAAEAVGEWLGGITAGTSDLLPNDVEALIGRLFGKKEETNTEDIDLSEGYVNMLRRGTYHMTYTLADGTVVEAGSNGVHTGSTYPESNEAPEPQYDENGDVIEQKVPMEHIVLSEGTYYYVDDSAATLYVVNPGNYKAVPFEIKTANIAFSQRGKEDSDGKSLYFEEYSTDDGSIVFYYNGATLTQIKVNQGEGYTFTNIVTFNKYLPSTLVALPSTYKVVK
jgi:hypothetical protein